MKKFLSFNENKITTYENLWNSKCSAKAKVYSHEGIC
jgi:hypothetical protein